MTVNKYQEYQSQEKSMEEARAYLKSESDLEMVAFAKWVPCHVDSRMKERKINTMSSFAYS
jgi:hypothetical protein